MNALKHRILMVALALGALLVLPAQAQNIIMPPPQRTISVSGEGIVRVEPDQAIVRFGVVSRSQDPEEARSLNAEAAKNAMNVVRALGIEERKMRLETLTLQPAREYDPDTRRYKEIGFEATRIVVVEVENLDDLPTLIARIVQQGANRLDGVTYELDNRDAARNEALVKALTDAREKATLMASTLDVTLGPVQTINEQSFNFPRPMLQMARGEMAMSKDAMPEPEAYAAGEIEVTATVQVVFTLE